MKKIGYIALALIVVLLAASCTTVEEENPVWYLGSGMMPVADVAVDNNWLQTDLFEVLGTASGSASVSVDGKRNYTENAYGSLTEDEITLMSNVRTVSQDPFAMALAAAVNEMNKNAVEMGASFVVFPNYFIENNDGVLTVNVNATGVKLTEGMHKPNSEDGGVNPITVKIE